MTKTQGQLKVVPHFINRLYEVAFFHGFDAMCWKLLYWILVPLLY